MADPTTIINTLDATFKTIDQNSGDIIITKTVGLVINGIAGQYTQRYKLQTAAVDTAMPTVELGNNALNIDQLYIKNVDPNAKVTIKWRIGAAAVANITILPPGGVLIFWNPTVIPGSTINSITCASDIGLTYVEIFQGVIS